MIEKITHKNKVFAMIIRKNIESESTKFFTPEDYPLQVGILKHGRGVILKPHVHRMSKKLITATQEVLYIERGKVEASFYTHGGKKIATKILNQGDILFLVDGGHGFKMLEDTKIIEVKQGPYNDVKTDKEIFKVS